MRLLALLCLLCACSSPSGNGNLDIGTSGDASGFQPIGSDTSSSDTPGAAAPDAAGPTPPEDVPSSADLATPDVPVAGEDTSKPSGVGQLAVDPESYTFSYISPMPESLLRQVSMFNTGTGPLTITSVGLVPGGSTDFVVSLIPPLPKVLQPGDSAFTLVVFKEGAGGTATLRIGSSDPERPTVDIPLASFLKADLNGPDPCASLSPTTLAFGAVERGDTKVLSTTLKNCSSETPLSLKDIKRGTSFFFPLTQEMQLAPAPALPTVIPPGGSLSIPVSYTPNLAGPDIGFFTVVTDDPAEPNLKLDVSGFGKEPPPEELGLTIKLSWDSDLCDVDSHFIQPGGTFFDCETDCYFGNPAPEWGTPGKWQDNPYLDVDDVDGYGPEHTNITEPVPGTYRFVVHYYDDSYEGSSSTDTNATVEVYSYGQLLATYGPVHLDVTNRNWDVFEVTWPSMQLTPLGNTYMTTTTGGFCFPNFP